MPRKLKTFVTTVGFFDLAVAAPSMKAALEAWGMTRNAFQQGFAEETDDPAVIAAATAKPGTVLKRPVGSKGAFKENAELPKSLPSSAPKRPKQPEVKVKGAKPAPQPKASKQAERAQILSFEKAQAKREQKRAAEEVEQAREEEKRQKAIDKAQALFDRARQRHDDRLSEIEKERAAAERKADAEETRWAREKSELEARLRTAKK